MLLKTGLIITAFLSLSVPESRASSVELTLPGGARTSFALNARTIGGRQFFYPDDLFEGANGAAWLGTLSASIDSAYTFYTEAVRAGLLAHCQNQSGFDPKAVPLFFLDVHNLASAQTDASAWMPKDGVTGFSHPDNRGPLIQSRFWRDSEAVGVAIHEMVHSWCQQRVPRTQSDFERWLEEGVAAWVVFRVRGTVPQKAISSYFRSPCSPTFYGSNLLFVLAQTGVKDDDSKFRLLAELHLGLRADLIYGGLNHKALNENALCENSRGAVVSGQFAETCPARPGRGFSSVRCLPIWVTPWQQLSVEKNSSLPLSLAGHFVWQVQ